MIVLIFGIIAVVLCSIMSIFQLLLAIGLPLGSFAYGGKYNKLPNNLRIMSIIAIGILVFASISVLARISVIPIFEDSIVFIIAMWIFAFYFTLNTLANVTSKSKSEQRTMTPLSLILAICCFIVAIGA